MPFRLVSVPLVCSAGRFCLESDGQAMKISKSGRPVGGVAGSGVWTLWQVNVARLAEQSSKSSHDATGLSSAFLPKAVHVRCSTDVQLSPDSMAAKVATVVPHHSPRPGVVIGSILKLLEHECKTEDWDWMKHRPCSRPSSSLRPRSGRPGMQKIHSALWS